MSKKPETLLMFSGGIDSTGALWKLLNEGSNLHVHHMNLINVERRHRAEQDAVMKVVSLAKKIGNFTFSQSSHEYPSFNRKFIWDSDIASFVAGTMCLSMPTIKKVALGMTLTDQNGSLSGRIVRANKVLAALAAVKKIYPVGDMNKQEIYDMLPAEWREAAWSCRRPLGLKAPFSECGKCLTCAEKKKLFVSPPITDDSSHWQNCVPPLAPNEEEIKLYQSLVGEGPVCLLGMTKSLMPFCDIAVDISPIECDKPTIECDWNDLDGDYGTVIGDGVLNLAGVGLVDKMLKLADRFVARVFLAKMPGMKYAKIFPTEFPGSTEVIPTQDNVVIVRWDRHH